MSTEKKAKNKKATTLTVAAVLHGFGHASASPIDARIPASMRTLGFRCALTSEGVRVTYIPVHSVGAAKAPWRTAARFVAYEDALRGVFAVENRGEFLLVRTLSEESAP